MIWLEVTLVSYYNERYFIRSLDDDKLVLWENGLVDGQDLQGGLKSCPELSAPSQMTDAMSLNRR